jgi:glycosyltransferase 2 family protein
MTRRHIMLLLRVACAGLLMWWALRRAELADLRDLPLWSLHIGWFTFAMLLGGLSVLGWALRFRVFLKIAGIDLSLWKTIRLTMFADFFNLYFLGPLGADGIRMLLLNQKYPGKKGPIFQAILIDHASGLLGGALLYALCTRPQSAWLTQGEGMIPKVALFGTDIFLGLFGIMTLGAVAVIIHKTVWDFTDRRRVGRFTLHPLRPFLYLREHKMELF